MMKSLLLSLLLLLPQAGSGRRAQLQAYNRALAAYQQQDDAACLAALEELPQRVRPRMQARILFLRGSLAYRASEALALNAQGPRARAQDWPRAISLAAQAARAWREAGLIHHDWPAALRNAERAERRLQDYRQQRDRNAGDSNAADSPREGQIEDPRTPPPPTEEQIEDWMNRLQQEEASKHGERRTRPALDRVEVERDW